MLKYVTLIAPLLLKHATSSPVKTLSGYMGAVLLLGLAAIFFLAALFTWTASHYGLDVAFLVTALILMIAAIGLIVMARRTKAKTIKDTEERYAQIKGMLAAKDDPLGQHVPDDILSHPAVQKILAEIEEKPFLASAAAIGLGLVISRQIFDGSD